MTNSFDVVIIVSFLNICEASQKVSLLVIQATSIDLLIKRLQRNINRFYSWTNPFLKERKGRLLTVCNIFKELSILESCDKLAEVSIGFDLVWNFKSLLHSLET
jgi:hypothetical protein